jgi:HK97 family phage prohead protease
MPTTNHIQRRLDDLRAVRVRCRRLIRDAHLHIADRWDREAHVQRWTEYLRGTEREYDELHLLLGKTPPSQLPRIRLNLPPRTAPAAAVVTKRYDMPLVVKVVSEAGRVITGLATTPAPDRLHDIVEPLGAKYQLPISLLLDHDHRSPVGRVTAATPSTAGITVRAEIAAPSEAGQVRDLCDRAWHLCKHQLIRALSIGFRPIRTEPLEGGRGLRYCEWEFLELSLVAVPAQAGAVITSVSSAA